MRLAILGAGAVGLTLGARLARAGSEVRFLVRRPEVAAAIETSGVTVVDPATGTELRAPAEAALLRDAAGDLPPDSLVLVCTRGSDVEPATSRLPHGATVVCFANDVENEARLARRFPRVVGGVLRHTCTRVAPDRTHALPGGRVVLGLHPRGGGADLDALAGGFRAADFDVGVSDRISEDKWLKLFVNLMSVPNALVRREDHEDEAFVALKVALLEEARAVFGAAGIAARSCDGRDRSLDEEIAYQREALARGRSARGLPLYNQVWAALRHGGPLEADAYHRRIRDLGRRHGVATPRNERVLAALLCAQREGRGPESASAASLLADTRAASAPEPVR